MKRLKSTIPDGGAPLGEFPVLKDIFDTENKDAIEALLTSITDGETEGVILSGCKVSGSSGDFDISAGYVYLDGKVLRYPGGEGFSATRYLQKASDTEESGTFADTVVRAYIDVEAAEDAGSAPGGGVQYVTVTHASGGRTLKDRMGDIINDDAVTVAKMAANSVDSAQYVDGSIDDAHLATDRVKSVGVQLLTKVIEIGDWNMDVDATINVPHGLSINSIRSVFILIRNDDNDLYTPLEHFNNGPVGAYDTGSFQIGSTNIVIRRESEYDNVNYDATSYNRGWITITYEE